MDLGHYLAYLASFITIGNFVIIDLIAAATNALNGALLAQRPDYYQGRQWSIVGILLLAILGGIGGGVTRDILLNKVPGALVNPWYLIVCLLAGFVGLRTSYKGGQRFRESWYQFQTAFSLPWYAAIGVNAGLTAHLPNIAAIALGVVGSTAGRYLIDVTAEKAAKQFVRGEWFVGTAVFTSIVYLLCAETLGFTIWPATLTAVAAGILVRVAALWFGWEEPLPRLPGHVVGEVARRETLKEKMQPEWEPHFD
jgi:uncharacterized membrane protein YeiH